MNDYEYNRGHERSVWVPLTEGQVRDEMQRHGFRHGEITAHVVDLNAGHTLTADDGTQFRKVVPMLHTAQDGTTVTRLVTYWAGDGRQHVERVTVYLAEMLDRKGLLVEMGGPDA